MVLMELCYFLYPRPAVTGEENGMLVTGGDNDTVVNLTDGTDQDASFSVQNSDCTEALFYHTGQILLRNGCLKFLPVGDVIQQVTDMNTAVNRVGRRIRHFIDGVDGDVILFRHNVGKLRHSLFYSAVCKMKRKNMK